MPCLSPDIFLIIPYALDALQTMGHLITKITSFLHFFLDRRSPFFKLRLNRFFSQIEVVVAIFGLRHFL